MSRVRIAPVPASGTVRAPPSKSYTHRALVAGYLARRRTEVLGALDSDDTRATLRGLAALGSRVERRPDRWVVAAPRRPSRRAATVRCGRSGTSLRFLLAVASAEPRTTRFVGDAELAVRPVGPLLAAVAQLGVQVVPAPRGRSLPTTVRGPILGGPVTVDAYQSSQFLSSLLLVLPTVPQRSVVRVPGRIASAPYVDATIAVLAQQGVTIHRRGGAFQIPGGQRGRGGRVKVPGDASSAAYLWAAAAVSGGEVTVVGATAPEWPQADLAILDLLQEAGARVRRGGEGVTVSGRLNGAFAASFDDTPDLLPLVGGLAAVTPGQHLLRGGVHAAWKESDRRRGTADLARRLGARVELRSGSIRITGTRHPQPLRGKEWHDHRLVMSAAVASLAGAVPSIVGDVRAVRKSFPGFWDAFAALGVPLEATR